MDKVIFFNFELNSTLQSHTVYRILPTDLPLSGITEYSK